MTAPVHRGVAVGGKQDLKTNNLLVGADGQLKICDFGMARPFGSPEHKLAHQVVTLYVREGGGG